MTLRQVPRSSPLAECAWCLPSILHSMADAMGPISTRSELAAALPVFEQVMRVLEFSLFADSGAAASSAQHGWCRYSRQPFWTGMYLLLRSVDAQPFAQLLVHFPYLVTLVRPSPRHAPVMDRPAYYEVNRLEH
jgi:hypothetical protein